MRRLAMIAGAALAIAGPALGADIGAALGNTIVSTHPDGRKARLMLSTDHSYRAQGRNGQRSSGTWMLKGEKLCLSQKKPYPGPFAYCSKVRSAKLGETWSDKAFNGEAVTNQIVAGQ